MITNLLASIVITFATNSIQTDNHIGCATCGWLEDCLRHGSVPAVYHEKSGECWKPYVAPTRRTTTTTITERKQLMFNWEGRERIVTEDRTLWQDTIVQEKKEEWSNVKAKPETQNPKTLQYVLPLATNWLLTNVTIWMTNSDKIIRPSTSTNVGGRLNPNWFKHGTNSATGTAAAQ